MLENRTKYFYIHPVMSVMVTVKSADIFPVGHSQSHLCSFPLFPIPIPKLGLIPIPVVFPLDPRSHWESNSHGYLHLAVYETTVFMAM